VSTEMGWIGHLAPVQSVDAEMAVLNAWLWSVSLSHAKRSVTTLNCQLYFVFRSVGNSQGKTVLCV